MNKQNIIQLTFFISILVFNPAVAENITPVLNIEAQEKSTVFTDIATCLTEKGLEEEVSHTLAKNVFVEDALTIETMMRNVENTSSVTRNELVQYVSMEALYKHKVSLHEYDSLIGMVSKIRKKSPDVKMLSEVRDIARLNSALV